MMKSIKHLTWAGAGLFLALTAGAPAVADDVELLLSTPATSNAAKPNVLFIIDSSGSMTRTETSQEPFDPNRDYSDRGSCDTDMYYWTYNSGIPKCGDEYKFKKTSFQCQQGRVQIDCHASSPVEAESLAEAVRLRMDGFRGEMNSGVFVQSCHLDDERMFYDPPHQGGHAEDGVDTKQLDYLIGWGVPVPSFA